ncbi:MAG: DUF465 domain-containing protein [Hyphomonadaceae bacterium]|jgi:hypothetical protein|uniref:YdcH family protein n=1 Tax=Aquidulcibacter sp. TaxID=2052990 RepID=UPI0022BC9BDE|nr:YdcH family protein [Aquidulcibacter sp.]MCE2892239.1 YdcH family protein [Hyphomonadaceae bacterium]MCZ8208926.1 YdcH family protein [Aquidulcibacter sp.]
MKLGRIEALKSHHSRLEIELATLAKRPFPEPELITRLKRQKLLVKDQLVAAGVMSPRPERALVHGH